MLNLPPLTNQAFPRPEDCPRISPLFSHQEGSNISLVHSLRMLLSKIITRSPSRLTDAIQSPKGKDPAIVCSHPETVTHSPAPEPGQYNPETDLSVRGSPR